MKTYEINAIDINNEHEKIVLTCSPTVLETIKYILEINGNRLSISIGDYHV